MVGDALGHPGGKVYGTARNEAERLKEDCKAKIRFGIPSPLGMVYDQ